MKMWTQCWTVHPGNATLWGKHLEVEDLVIIAKQDLYLLVVFIHSYVFPITYPVLYLFFVAGFSPGSIFCFTSESAFIDC